MFLFVVISHGIAVSTKNWLRLDQGAWTPLRWILHYLFTHGQIAQQEVCGLKGHNQIFSMQIRPLSVSNLSVAFMLFLLRANQVPFCYWTTCVSYLCCLTVYRSHWGQLGVIPVAAFGILCLLSQDCSNIQLH